MEINGCIRMFELLIPKRKYFEQRSALLGEKLFWESLHLVPDPNHFGKKKFVVLHQLWQKFAICWVCPNNKIANSSSFTPPKIRWLCRSKVTGKIASYGVSFRGLFSTLFFWRNEWWVSREEVQQMGTTGGAKRESRLVIPTQLTNQKHVGR